jgi:hypothetical protein
MTIPELEQIEICAQRGLPVDSELILKLTAFLRDTLQAKAITEAIAVEAVRKAGMQSSRYYTAPVSRQALAQASSKR